MSPQFTIEQRVPSGGWVMCAAWACIGNIAGPGQRGFIVSSDLFWWADRIPMQLGNGLQNTQMHSACTGPGSAWDRQPVPGSSATLKAEYFSVGYLVAVSAKKAKKEEDYGPQVIC
jgi:hypothetical protein